MIVRTMQLLVLIGLVLCGTTNGQYSWDGGGTDTNWSTAANWNPDGSPPSSDIMTTVFLLTSSVVDYGDPFMMSLLTIAGSDVTLSGNPLKVISLKNRTPLCTIENAIDASSGSSLFSSEYSSACQLVVNGNINGSSLNLRGNAGAGFLNGTVNLTTGLTKLDKCVWTIASTGNTIPTLTIYRSTLKLGASDALSSTCVVNLGMSGYTGTFDLNGYNQTVSSLKLSTGTSVGGDVTNSSATPSTFTLDGSTDSIYVGTLTGNLGLTKKGNGRLYLRTANTYTGDTNVYPGGGIGIQHADALASSANIIVHDGAAIHKGFTLGTNQNVKGNGYLYGSIIANGTIEPGIDGIGTLEIGASNAVQDLTINGTYRVDVTVSGGSDLLKVYQNLTLGAASVLTINNPSQLTAGQTYMLATYAGTLTGTFASTNLPAGWSIDYGAGTNGVITLSSEVTPISGDANNDGMVDVGDLGILAANYGTASGATWSQGDFNNDGAVDVGDLGILAAHYGEGTDAAVDFNVDYAKAFGTTVTEEDDSTTGSSLCGTLGLPLIAGLVLMSLMLVKLEK